MPVLMAQLYDRRELAMQPPIAADNRDTATCGDV